MSQRTKTKSELTRKSLIAATALTTFAAVGIASSSAATQHHRRLFMQAPQSQEIARPQSQQTTREKALQECNNAARKYTERDWQTLAAATYASCMTNHGQTS